LVDLVGIGVSCVLVPEPAVVDVLGALDTPDAVGAATPGAIAMPQYPR
jgi:hypothetical protein